MTLLERLRQLFQATIALPERRWAAELDHSEEDELPFREADHTYDDPGPEWIATGELHALDSDEE